MGPKRPERSPRMPAPRTLEKFPPKVVYFAISKNPTRRQNLAKNYRRPSNLRSRRRFLLHRVLEIVSMNILVGNTIDF